MKYAPIALFVCAAACTHPADILDPAPAPDDGAASASEGFSRASPADHRFCGWLYGSSNPATMNRAYDTFAAHAASFDAVHPVWWHIASPTLIEPRSIGFDDPRVLANTTPGGRRTRLIPTIEATDRPDFDFVHRIIHDPELRRKHIADIDALIAAHRYDGIDLDYEHLSTTLGPGETMKGERRAFSEFVAELAAVLHAHGKVLTLAVPVVSPGTDAYDYDALSASADTVHVMGYDFHYEEGPHVGPVAPLGWIRAVVADIDALEGGSRRERFMLGLPNYGLVGRSAHLCSPSSRCLEIAGDDYLTTTRHMSRCPMAGGAVEAGRSPNKTLPSGEEMYFDDLASLEEKVEVAESGGLGGVAYWSIGGEPDRPGTRTFFEMVRIHFPALPGR